MRGDVIGHVVVVVVLFVVVVVEIICLIDLSKVILPSTNHRLWNGIVV